jgi:hypothetical protein
LQDAIAKVRARKANPSSSTAAPAAPISANQIIRFAQERSKLELALKVQRVLNESKVLLLIFSTALTLPTIWAGAYSYDKANVRLILGADLIVFSSSFFFLV